MSQALNNSQRRGRLLRGLLLAVGALSLLLGLIGIALPLLPTVPFLLLTAACWSRASRASRRWHRWLLSRPSLGPAIERWERERTVPRRARWAALAMLTLSMGAMIWWLRGHPWLPSAMAALWAVVVLVIARLPTARDGAR